MRRSFLRVGLVAVVCLTASPSQAGNSEHPRTPVHWPDADCIHTVDPALDPLFSFAYSIPFEDTFLSIDEFDDSRTHQFVGFCRQWPAGRPPPRYVSVADLERAIDADFELVLELGDPEATLETSEIWAGCWTRITADDARRPITFAAAAEPVVWDTSGLEPGTYMVAGYTWEPPYNLWSRTPWVVRVLDELDQAPIQAAAAIADTDDSVYFDEIVELELCVDAELGANVSIEWAKTEVDPDADLVWAAIPSAATELAAAGPQVVSLAFGPPEPSFGATMLLRATVEPIADPIYVAHALGSMTVFKPSDESDDSASDDSESEDGESETGATGSAGSETGETDPGADDPPSSARCSLVPERGNLAPLLFGFGLLALARARPRRIPTSENRP